MDTDWRKWPTINDAKASGRDASKHQLAPKKKRVLAAPTRIIGLPNPDKIDHDAPYSEQPAGTNLARFPGPFRCCIIGRVNSGKSLIAKYILMAHQAEKPKFGEVYVVHGMGNTDEYDDIEPTELMTEIPAYDEFEKSGKKLILIDDYDFTRISRDQLQRLSELFRFGSSHQNMSLILMHQSWFRVPKIIKDCCNVFIIYRPVDDDELVTIGRRVGLTKDQIRYIFDTYMPHFRDSLTVNTIPGAPYKYLKNLYEPLNIDFNTPIRGAISDVS